MICKLINTNNKQSALQSTKLYVVYENSIRFSETFMVDKYIIYLIYTIKIQIVFE